MQNLKEGNIVKHLLNNNYYVIVSTGYLHGHHFTCLLATLEEPTTVVLTALFEELELIMEEETDALKVLYENPKNSSEE